MLFESNGVSTVFGLLLGETFVFQLINHTLSGEGHDAEIIGGGLGCLRFPIGTAVIDRIGSLCGGKSFVFQLVNQATVGESGNIQIVFGGL